ncbi:MAG TPA: sulfide/dihydroorotate dehydrogenase-like FAD/NAD-binding protein [Bacillota bacterium]|nr:sulfide/dihydroorotate dehydrogenase-like FAD/NAD-binding protein [Bacillota bacterium]HOA15198.1 sulfide/dihydroorotate dehydrogenase-like FAD/NAD-binding protein [Bacillota bacterium]HOG53165.1 sulfide/dihydroorotate dehydrogenase-like FAD/NAD-binding protein [Bacillota bacterium]
MHRILGKRLLAPSVYEFVLEAPLVARAAKPGNFVMVRADERGERVPLTIVDHDGSKGIITIVVQQVGASTTKMCLFEEGESFQDVLGPCGKPTSIEKVGTVIAVAGGIGIAPLIPQIREHMRVGNKVVTILGARTENLYVLKDTATMVSSEMILCTDDGSCGFHGFVTQALEEYIKSGRPADEVVAIGPVRMMKACSEVTRKYGIKTTVSLNATMLDGTGMCGCCRVTVGGVVKFSCVDGPEFDAHQVDFDELIKRQTFFREEERKAMELHRSGEGCKCR